MNWTAFTLTIGVIQMFTSLVTMMMSKKRLTMLLGYIEFEVSVIATSLAIGMLLG